MPLFPAADRAEQYEAVARDEARLAPGVRAIGRRHGLGEHEPSRFPDGSLPVYALGPERVLKLYPPCYAHEVAIEQGCLAAVAGRIGIPTPEVAARGDLEGWSYLLMSRLKGVSLAAAWPSLSRTQREALVEQLGAALARLHALSVAGLAAPHPAWPEFLGEQRRTAAERQRRRRLPEAWVEQIPAFLADVPLAADAPGVLLHTEVMREHLLVEGAGGAVRLSGLFDFEPAMVGAADYEFASVGLFVTCGEPGLLRRLLLAYGRPPADLGEGLARRFLALALLHRYANLPWYLERLAPPPDVTRLGQLARRWWSLA